MCLHRPPVFKLVLPAALSLLALPVRAQINSKTVKVDCSVVLEQMRMDIAKEPGRLVLALEDALTTSEICVCPIIRAAVDLAGRDPALTSEILIAAIHLLPASSAQITECVLLEAPDAAPAIRAALIKELGEKSPGLLESKVNDPADPAVPAIGMGKSPVGKAPAMLPPTISPELQGKDGQEFAEFFPSIGVSGVYFTSPASGGARGTTLQSIPKIYETIIKTTKSPPRRPVLPVTRSIPE